jgi:hypothetical protein
VRIDYWFVSMEIKIIRFNRLLDESTCLRGLLDLRGLVWR